MSDIRTSAFNEKQGGRLFIVIGHGVLTPLVGRKETKSGYSAAAAVPSTVPIMPGVLITAGERGKSVELTQFIGERAVSLPHEILMRIQKQKQDKKNINVQDVKDMLRQLKRGGEIFPENTTFTVRAPGSELASAVMWASGERVIYGGVWMIDLKNPSPTLTNASGMFGLVERPTHELECRQQELDARKQRALRLASEAYGYTPGSDESERMKTDLSLAGQCNGELKYAGDGDRLITMRDFLAQGQSQLRPDDIMVVVMCRHYASYAAEYMYGVKSPRDTTTHGKVHDFGGGRLKKRKSKGKSKKTKKKTRTLKKKTKMIRQNGNMNKYQQLSTSRE